MAIVIKNTKDASFSSEQPYMVVTFVRNYNSRFAVGSMAETKYELKYDLRQIYPQFRDETTGVFDVNAASKLFLEEMPVGSNEDVNLFDFTIKELTNGEYSAVKKKFSISSIEVWHVACYNSDKGFAKEVARDQIWKGIYEKELEWID